MRAHFFWTARPWKVSAYGRSVVIHVRTNGLTPRWRKPTASEVAQQRALARRLGATRLRVTAAEVEKVEMAY